MIKSFLTEWADERISHQSNLSNQMRNIEMQLGQSFRDYVDTLLKGYSEEVYSGAPEWQYPPMTIVELIDSHREIRRLLKEKRLTYRNGYSAGYIDAQRCYCMDNWIEISELRGMTIEELVEFLKNEEGE